MVWNSKMHCASLFENNGLKKVLVSALGEMFEMSSEFYFIIVKILPVFESCVIDQIWRPLFLFENINCVL